MNRTPLGGLTLRKVDVTVCHKRCTVAGLERSTEAVKREGLAVEAEEVPAEPEDDLDERLVEERSTETSCEGDACDGAT